MKSTHRGLVGEAITLLALLLMLIVGVTMFGLYRGARKSLEDNGPALMRARTYDRLMGTRLKLASLTGGGETEGPAVIWVVDLDSCKGCLDTVTPWLELEKLGGDYDLHFLMVGGGDQLTVAESRARLFRRTNVMRKPRDSIFAALGPTLPSTKLLVDPNGIILLVDSRSSGQECGWSFEAQVGALLGLETAHGIRPQTVNHLTQ